MILCSDSTANLTDERVLAERAASLALEAIVDEPTDHGAVLLFRVGAEWYGVDVGDVREILQDATVTPIPCLPQHVLGVVNVRGEIVSATDAARMMDLGAVSLDGHLVPTAIVISDGEVATALVVDEVGDIVEISGDSREAPLSTIGRTLAEYVAASATVGDTVVGLIRATRVLEPVSSRPND